MSTQNQIRTLLARHGIHLKRALGQSFLIDDLVLDRIARVACSGGERTIVEIGAGLGVLTARLAGHAAHVVAIERDATLVPVLREELRCFSHVDVVEADALEMSFGDLGRLGERPAMTGNLPYSITSPLLLALLQQRDRIGRTTIMIQREVAERLVAVPNTRAYGSLTVLFRLYADVTRLFDVAPESFLPRPKVQSSVVELAWLRAPRVRIPDPAEFERVVRAAFSHRRKTLRNALGRHFPRDQVASAGTLAGVALERRAETLTLEEFSRLSFSLLRPASAPGGSPSDR